MHIPPAFLNDAWPSLPLCVTFLSWKAFHCCLSFANSVFSENFPTLRLACFLKVIRSRFPESWRKSRQVYDGHVKSSLKSEKYFHSFETERNFYVSAVASPSLTMLYPCFSEAMGHAVTMCTEEAKGTQSICYFFLPGLFKVQEGCLLFLSIAYKDKGWG